MLTQHVYLQFYYDKPNAMTSTLYKKSLSLTDCRYKPRKKGYVLIDSDHHKQSLLNWDSLALNKNIIQKNTELSYSYKKHILSKLTDKKLSILKKSLNLQTQTDKFNRTAFNPQNNATKPTQNSTNIGETYTNNIKTRVKSMASLKQTASSDRFRKQINLQSLKQRILNADMKNKKIIGIFTIRKFGLRVRIQHSFAQVCKCKNQSHNGHKIQQNSQIKELVKQMIPLGPNSYVYYFNFNKESILNSADIRQNQFSIIANSSAKLTIDSDIHIKLYEQCSKIQKHIRQIQDQLQINRNSQISEFTLENDQQQNDYDWKNIKNVGDYVNKLCENPQFLKPLKKQTNGIKRNQVQTWYNQKFIEPKMAQLRTQKNPILESTSHYPQQTKNKNILNLVSKKIQQFGATKNIHKFKKLPIQNMLQRIRRQEQNQVQKEKQQLNLKIQILSRRKPETSKKQIMRKLQSKHSLLFEQNIPYMMEKYGINRFQIHSLFNLYKGLEKISALRVKNKYQGVLDKGIDRSTFDEGLKKLDINPGEQVIKNICYFDDFINWEQFVKIISIGLRKTPEQKLQAILSGIGGANNGQLTKAQISIMIGSSLSKIFDSEQTQLREYFTQMAMRDLDKDNSGTVDVEQIKLKVLSFDPSNLDLVSFLLLNS